MWTLEKSIIIERPIEEVYGYATNPALWYQWYAGLSEPGNMTGEGEVGTKADFTYTMIGMRLPIAVEVIENKQSGLGYSWKGEVTGSITSHQHWTYTKEGRGTKVSYAEAYEMPSSVLRKVADKLIIRKLLDNAMEQTFKNLKDVCEAKKMSA